MLYVARALTPLMPVQTQRALLRFELENEVNATVLIKGLPDIPEQIMLMEEC